MRTAHIGVAVSLAFFLALSLPILPAEAATYTIVDLTLESLTGANLNGAADGQQVGVGSNDLLPGGYHAILWTGTVASAVDLNPDGYEASCAYGIGGGQQVGYAYGEATDGFNHAALWTGTAASYIDLSPEGYVMSEAYGAAGGQQVGYVIQSIETPNTEAALWTGTAESFLSLNPDGFISSAALGTCGTQQVGYGASEDLSGSFADHALLWSGTAASVVDLNPDGFGGSYARATNGTQQGGSGWGEATDYNLHALLWAGTAESGVDLNPVGFTESEIWSINAVQQVGCGLGEVTGDARHALLWNGSASGYLDLHLLLSGDFVESCAYGIDAAGNIVGQAYDSEGNSYAVLWQITGASLVWNGGASNTWDVGSTIDWRDGAADSTFGHGDHVAFTDQAGQTTAVVSLATALMPASVVVNNTATDYTFGGSGSLIGTTGLVKQGSGRLTLANANTYTGDTEIQAGTVVVAADGALGGGAVRLGDTTSAADAALLIGGAYTVDRPITVQDDGSGSATLTLGGSHTTGTSTFLSDILVEADLTLTAASGGTVRFEGGLDDAAGCTITKIGDGTVVLAGDQTYADGTLLDVVEGLLRLETDAGDGLSITVTEAALEFGCNQHLDTLTIGDGGVVRFAGARVVVLEHLVINGFDLGSMTLTPEPATLGLLGLGGAAMLIGRRRRAMLRR